MKVSAPVENAAETGCESMEVSAPVENSPETAGEAMEVSAPSENATEIASEALFKCMKQLNLNDGDHMYSDTDEAVSQMLSHLQKHLLSLPKPISSADMPYRLVRDAAFDIVQRSSDVSPGHLVSACKLYLNLVKLIPISFDEAAFTAVLNLMTNSLRRPSPSSEDPALATNVRKRRNAASIPKDVLSCWQLLVDITLLQVFAQNFAVVGQVTATGFAALLTVSSTAAERSVSTSGLKLLSRVCNGTSSTANFSFIYKALIPVTLSGLPSAVKTDLINFLRFVVSSEKVEVERISQEASALREIAEDDDDDEEEGPSEEPVVEDSANGSELGANASVNPTPPPASNSSEVNLQFIGFLHFCCANIPEKSDDRKTVLDVVTKCMASLDTTSKIEFVETFPRLARHPRSTVRSFVSTIAVNAFSESEESDSSNQRILATVSSLLCGRTKDKVPSVRAKALSSLASIICTIDATTSLVLVQKLCSEKGYLGSLARDEKVSVRKSYVLLAGAIVKSVLARSDQDDETVADSQSTPASKVQDASSHTTVHDWLQNITIRSSDSMSSVRKAAVLEISKIGLLILSNDSPQVQKMVVNAWTAGVLRRIEDDDPACQEACVESFTDMFISAMTEEGKTSGESTWTDEKLRTEFIDFVLSLAGDEASSLAHIIQGIMKRVSTTSSPPIDFLNALAKRILDGESAAHGTTSNVFGTLNKENLRSGTWAMFAECLTPQITASQKKKLNGSKLYQISLAECSLSSGLVAAFFSSEANSENQSTSLTALVDKLFFKAEWTDTFWRKSVRAVVDTIAGVNKISGSLLLERCEKELDTFGNDTATLEQLTLLAIIGECVSKLQLSAPPPQSVLNFVLAMGNLHQSSTTVRASAILTLGKLCLCEGTTFNTKPDTAISSLARNQLATSLTPAFFENFARSNISLFIRELQDDTSIPVRNNCILVLSDLCRRFTSIVEPYQTRIAARLSDPSEMIRCHVLGSIGSLLQEDYIKVRNGAVFFRIVLSLLDSSEQVRTLAKYVLTRILHPKSRTILATSIIELLYVLNGCAENKKYNQFPGLHIGLSNYTHRPGADSRKHYPYEVFLNTISEDQAVLLSSRTCSEVLTPIVDGKICIKTEDVKGVLFDALALLEMIEKRQTRENTVDESAPARTGEDGARTTKAALLRKLRVAELKVSLVPLLLELRDMLEAERSPILESLRNTLHCVLKPHRKNLEDIISDPAILSELSHELAKPPSNRRSSSSIDSESQGDTEPNVNPDTANEPDSAAPHEEEEEPIAAPSAPVSQEEALSTPAAAPQRRSQRLSADSPLNRILEASPRLAVYVRGVKE